MSVEKVMKLDFKTAVALGKLVCPAELEVMQRVELPSVEAISKELGIHLNSVKRWIAESAFVGYVPNRFFVTGDFVEGEAEPLEILAYYVHHRLGFTLRYEPDE